MKKYFSNKKEKLSQVTRFIPDSDIKLFKDFTATGKKRERDGEKYTQFVIFPNLSLQELETLDEAKKVFTEAQCLDWINREYRVTQIDDAVKEKFVAMGYVKPKAERKVSIKLLTAYTNMFKLLGGEIDENGVATKPCKLQGKVYNTPEELGVVVG